MPKLSICIPTYNRADLLAETLPTVLNQTYGDFEIVIVDNASPDNTEELVRSIRDPRIRYVRNPSNVGLIRNQNRAIEEARGELVAVYHDHDIYHPEIVQRSIDILEGHPEVGLVCSAIHLVDPDDPGKICRTDIMPFDTVTPGWTIRRMLLHEWNCFLPAPTCMARRELYQKAGAYKPEFGGAADREMWLRILAHCDLGYISEPMARLRDRNWREPAADHWGTLAGQVRIQSVHLERMYSDSSAHRWLERQMLHGKQFSEFWKWALWGIAKREPADYFDEAVNAFRQTGMRKSAALLGLLNRSRIAAKAIGAAFQLYKRSKTAGIL